MSVAEKMTAIADAIRDKTGKTDKLSLDNMAEEISSISGGESGINPEWTNWRYFCAYGRDSIATKLKYSDTSKGTNFYGMFSQCGELTTIPRLDTSNGTDFSAMFEQCKKLTSIPQLDTSKSTTLSSMFTNCGELTTIPQLDSSKCTSFSNMFQYCRKLTSISPLNTSSGKSFGNMFNQCNVLTSIPQLDLTNATSVSSILSGCTALVDLNIVGTINITGFSASACTLLTHDSLMSIINALADKTGVSGTWKVTLGSTNLAKLTADEIAIAEGKGWTVA